MDYLDNYSKKITNSGNSISESIVNNTNHYIQSKFKDSSTYRLANFYHRKNIVTTTGSIDIRALEIRRMGNIRNVLLRPGDNLDIGNTIIFDNFEWLVYDKYGNSEDSIKLEVGKINDKIRWRDATGLVHALPCVSGVSYLGSKSRQNRFDIEYNTYDVRLPTGQLIIFTEYNDETKVVDLNQRFIFGDRVYEVVGIDNVTLVETDGYGIVQFSVKITTKREQDDFVNKIADNDYKVENDKVDGGESSWGW